MTLNIVQQPASAAARVRLAPHENIVAEGGAMVAMSDGIQVETTTRSGSKGGILKGLGRALAGESIFLNHFTAGPTGDEVILAPTLSGDIAHVPLSDRGLKVQRGSFLAHSAGLEMGIEWQGFKGAFAKEGMIWLNFSGVGDLLLSAFGSLYSVDVDGSYVVDTGHIVAYEDGLDYRISKAGKSILSSFLGGEGLVCRFEGKGRLWCQSHDARQLGHHLTPHLTPKNH
ncbi:MAG: TIGR00266 family protein [Spirochaetales bacterium]|nr:TIGR00266 family protein [Spirochaetales bacterium]